MTWEAGLNSKYPAPRLIKKRISVCQWLSDKTKKKKKKREDHVQ